VSVRLDSFRAPTRGRELFSCSQVSVHPFVCCRCLVCVVCFCLLLSLVSLLVFPPVRLSLLSRRRFTCLSTPVFVSFCLVRLHHRVISSFGFRVVSVVSSVSSHRSGSCCLFQRSHVTIVTSRLIPVFHRWSDVSYFSFSYFLSQFVSSVSFIIDRAVVVYLNDPTSQSSLYPSLLVLSWVSGLRVSISIHVTHPSFVIRLYQFTAVVGF